MPISKRDTWAFILLCVIWGSTWIGTKAALDAIPPLFLGGTRFTVAGVILLALNVPRHGWTFARADAARLVAASLLIIALCYGALFWGMRSIDSGTAAVLDMGLTPIALLGFAILLGEERLSARKLGAIALGLAGLAALFGATAGAAGDAFGALAVASAAITYGWGSVVARPLLRAHPPAIVAGATTLIGGVVLLAVSLAVEPGAGAALRLDWGRAAWAGWLFLLLFGSLLGYSIYIRLLRDIGASRAGMYAFVSPVIAVGLGALLRDERLGPVEAVGMVVLLLAAWLAMSGPADMSAEPATAPARA